MSEGIRCVKGPENVSRAQVEGTGPACLTKRTPGIDLFHFEVGESKCLLISRLVQCLIRCYWEDTTGELVQLLGYAMFASNSHVSDLLRRGRQKPQDILITIRKSIRTSLGFGVVYKVF